MKKIFAFVFDGFSKIASMIFLFSTIYIEFFWGARTCLETSYLITVLGLSLFYAVLRIPFMFQDTFSKMKLLAANIIYFAIINATVMLAGYHLEWFNKNSTKSIIGLEATIVLVYIIVTMSYYIKDSNLAEKMNKILKSRKEEN